MSESQSLKPLAGWSAAFRGRFLDQRLGLYRDGDLVERKRSPASFELGPGASIEAAIGVFEGTLEAWRLGLAGERPGLSTVIGAVSWTVLVIALVTGIGELLGLAGLEIGPLALPAALNLVLGVAAIAAAIERALRFKSNRWLD